MTYASKTADNTGLYLDAKTGRPQFLEDPANPQDYWPVDETVPFDHHRTGWELVDGVCRAVSAQNSPNYRERLTERVRARREEIVNDGTTVESDGRLFWTDDKSQNDMNKALTLMQLAGISSLLWSGSGWTGAITLAELGAASVAVGALVQQSFGRRAELLAQIESVADADLPAFSETIEAFWPVE